MIEEYAGVFELAEKDGIFVGFKLDGGLRYQVENLEGPNRRYVSPDDSTNLRLCRLGGETYVGKLIEGELTTDRVDDVRRNVLSIMQRLFPDVRMPGQLRIVPCRLPQESAPAPEATTSSPDGAAGTAQNDPHLNR